jgi:endonuclease NucS-like protein
MIEEKATKVLPLKAAYIFGAEHGLEREVNEIRDMDVEWEKPYTSSLRRGYIVELLEKHGLFDEFKGQYWPVGNSPEGERLRRRFITIKEQHEDWLRRGGIQPVVDEEEESDQAFAAETDLRDFLAKNLSCIEPGLRLYQSGERSGIEFPVEDGRIDVLAIDRSERFVVIELKVGRGRNKALGQLLYYMGMGGQEPWQGAVPWLDHRERDS